MKENIKEKVCILREKSQSKGQRNNGLNRRIGVAGGYVREERVRFFNRSRGSRVRVRGYCLTAKNAKNAKD